MHFTGKERDPESNLDNFGARYDSSSMGRFMSPDWSDDPDPVPYADLNDPQTLNLYSYIRNNPLTLTDPDGHHEVCNSTTTSEDGVIVQVIRCTDVPDISVTAVAIPFIDNAEFGPPDWALGLAAIGTVAAINCYRSSCLQSLQNFFSKSNNPEPPSPDASAENETPATPNPEPPKGKNAGKKVRDILRGKKASIKNAPLPPGSPSWESIMDDTWEDIQTRAKAREPGYDTIRKLLSDSRFNR